MTEATTDAGGAEQASTGRIRGNMGPFEIAFFTVAAAGPLLVVAGFLPIAFMIGGTGAVGAQLVAGLVLLLFAVGLTRMALRIPNAGAFYPYIGRGLGKPVGGGAAFMALMAYAVITIGQFGAVGAFAVGPIKSLLGLDVPWWSLSLLAIAIVGYLGHRQISLSAKVLGAALLTETGVLLMLAIPVLIQGGAEGYDFTGFQPSSIFAGAGAGAMFAIVFGAFIGFESTAIYSEEARDPAKTLPRAVYLAVGFLTIFYTFMAWVIVIAFGKSNITDAAIADPVGLVFAAMETYVGHSAVVVMEVLLVTSAFASVLAFHNTASRYMFALGRERMLPSVLAKPHHRHTSPYIASWVMTIVSLVLIVLFALLQADPYLQVFLLGVAPGVIAIIVLQSLCAVAIVVYFNHHDRRHGLSRWSTLVAPLVSAIALAIAAWLIITNFEYFTGQTGAINYVLLSILPIVFAIGVARTLYIKRSDPAQYELLTETKIY